MTYNSLLDPLQSAYCKANSTKTTITYVFSDLLLAFDSNDIVFVTLLDCSTAFSLVDHQILLQHISN